jgi:hypothetical protein
VSFYLSIKRSIFLPSDQNEPSHDQEQTVLSNLVTYSFAISSRVLFNRMVTRLISSCWLLIHQPKPLMTAANTHVQKRVISISLQLPLLQVSAIVQAILTKASRPMAS